MDPPGARATLRLRQMLAWSFLVGVCGGALGFAYLGALHGLEHLLGPSVRSPGAQVLVLAAAGVVVAGLYRLLGPPGDLELLVDNIHLLEGQSQPRRLRSLLPTSLVCIASGGGMGPEAPLVQTTGTLAQWLAERLRLAPIDRRHMTIAGMAAAFTVLFGAPLGAAIFALEILHRRGLQYYEALLPAVVSSLVGYVVYVVASGLGLTPVWTFAASEPVHASDLALAALGGVLGAGIAYGFSWSVHHVRRAFQRTSPTLRPILGGVLLGLLGLASPYALTYGKAQVDPLLASQATVGVFVLAAAAKLLGTSVTIGAGWRGGFIIPLFFIGAASAGALNAAFQVSNEAVLAAALMAAVNTGVTKTPIGSTLVVCKMAGLQLVPSTLLAAILALLLTHRTGLLESQRERAEKRETSA